MQWPSKDVSFGGILHPAKANYTPETRQFIKVLMDESKMTMLQRKKFDYFLRNGEPLPKPKPGHKMGDELTPTKIPPQIIIRPTSSKRRSYEKIRQSGAYERDKFIPKPIRDRETEKNRLANQMAFGKDIEPKVRSKPRPQVSQPIEEVSRFDQLVNEIKERQDWLKQMDELGEAHKYRPIIHQQIQEKLREMEQIKNE